MPKPTAFDELDLLLVTALQTSPRADWQRIGRVLGVSASTAARRWARLNDEGLAWLSCFPLRLPGLVPVVAIIEIDCACNQLQAVATQIAEDPHVFTVNQATGARDILVTAVFPDHASLGRYVTFRLGGIEGVTGVRSQIATVHREASQWRLDRLQERHWNALRVGRPAPPSRGAALDATDLAIMAALREDCRRPATVLAEVTNLSASAVHRRLARLEADRVLVYRCDVASVLAGWPVSVTLWAVVPPDRLAHAVAELAGVRELRLCVSLSGPYNLMLGVWLRSMGDLAILESQLAKRIPSLVVTDRAVVLWQLKLGGHLLDRDGRRLRSIPVNAWPESDAAAAEGTLLDRLRAG
jgi:DNA-binding Lrp family transcriptional regulator